MAPRRCRRSQTPLFSLREVYVAAGRGHNQITLPPHGGLPTLPHDASPSPTAMRDTLRMKRILPAAVTIMVAAAIAAADLAPATAAPPTGIVTEFTRRVQPLLLNRCANGACHGGPDAAAPRLVRGDAAGRIDREITLANMDAILAACGPGRDPAAIITTISGRHPESARSPHQLAEPLTPRERATLESWLHAAATAQTFAASAAQPGGRNRLQQLLDAAANPPPLPPPEEARGLRLE
jgi:hypothetical protein